MSEYRMWAEVRKASQESHRDFCRFVSYASFFTVVFLVGKRLSTRENPDRPAPRTLQPPPPPIQFHVTTKNTLCQEFSTLRFCLCQSFPSQMSSLFLQWGAWEPLWQTPTSLLFCGRFCRRTGRLKESILFVFRVFAEKFLGKATADSRTEIF